MSGVCHCEDRDSKKPSFQEIIRRLEVLPSDVGSLYSELAVRYLVCDAEHEFICWVFLGNPRTSQIIVLRMLFIFLLQWRNDKLIASIVLFNPLSK